MGWAMTIKNIYLNSFIPDAHFLHTLKTSENLKVDSKKVTKFV